MSPDKEIQDRLSRIFNRIESKVILVLCSITSEEQLDAAVEWLDSHHPEKAPSSDAVDWMKESIKKWGGNLQEQFSDDFRKRFPLIAEKLNASEGNMLIFLRMTKFCGADPEFLAENIEPIIRAHEVEGKNIYTVNINIDSGRWANLPRNKQCFVLRTVARYTETPPWTFREVFLPDLKSSGGGSQGTIHFDWRPAKEREKNPV